MPVLKKMRRHQTAILWLSLWTLAIAAGFLSLMAHETSAGDTAVPPYDWTDDAPFERATDRPTLLFFAHPHCPCVRASVAELQHLLAASSSPVRVYIIVFGSDDADFNAKQRANWLTDIRGQDTRTIADPGGRIALQFGVLTSGDCLLYGRSGHLIYRGGITSSRGELGPSIEQMTLAHLIADPTTSRLNVMPVFGCPLFESRPSPAGR